MGGGSSVGVGGWGSDPGGVRVGNGAGGAGAVGVGADDWPGGVQPGVGEPVGRGVALGSGVALMAMVVGRGSSIPNS